jgi:membrane protease YdiL (CAAX protease family)
MDRETISAARQVFAGRGGLWAVWGAALFLVVYSSLDAIVGRLLDQFYALRVVGPVPLSTALIREAIGLAVVLGSTWVMSKVMRRGFRSYGYMGHNSGMRLGTGAAWGFTSLSALILCMWLTGHLVFDGSALRLESALTLGAGWGLVFLMIGILEESLFRGFLQHTLADGVGFWWATLTVSGAFILWHVRNADESTVGLLSTGAGSLLFSLSLWYTRSLWWAIGFHAGWDWGQSFFYGTPDSGVRIKSFLLRQHPQGNPMWSGGTVGPEGSLFLFPLLCLLCVGMWLWWGRLRNFDESSPWTR